MKATDAYYVEKHWNSTAYSMIPGYWVAVMSDGTELKCFGSKSEALNAEL